MDARTLIVTHGPWSSCCGWKMPLLSLKSGMQPVALRGNQGAWFGIASAMFSIWTKSPQQSGNTSRPGQHPQLFHDRCDVVDGAQAAPYSSGTKTFPASGSFLSRCTPEAMGTPKKLSPEMAVGELGG